eukprot:4906358-Amphidinium_carterae.1
MPVAHILALPSANEERLSARTHSFQVLHLNLHRTYWNMAALGTALNLPTRRDSRNRDAKQKVLELTNGLIT